MLMLVSTLALCSTPSKIQASNKAKVGNGWYTVVSEKGTYAQYEKPASKSLKTVSIPDEVQIGNTIYYVSRIADNAFKNNKKLQKVTIGRNMVRIGKNAFYGCKSLKNITIRTIGLTEFHTGSNAFKGLNAKAVITVPLEKVEVYTDLISDRGFTGRSQKIKGKKMNTTPSNQRYEESNTTWDNYDSSKSLPEPKSAAFTIGNFVNENVAYIDEYKITESAEYNVGDDIQFTAGIHMSPYFYGDWKNEKVLSDVDDPVYLKCGYCGKDFSSENLFGLHYELMDCDGMNYYIVPSPGYFYGWNFYPDDTPCEVIYNFTLSDGLSYKEDSIKVRVSGLHNAYNELGENIVEQMDIPNENYDLKISGNRISVTIKDIKSYPFYIPFDKKRYDKTLDFLYEDDGEAIVQEGGICPVKVLFNTNFNENTQPVNTVSADITYSYKGNTKTIDLGSRDIYSASMKINHTDTDGNPLTGGTFTLYAEEPVFKDGSNLGTYEWKKVESGLKSGDVIRGIGKKYYKLVQETAPDGYRKSFATEFSVGIKASNGSVTVTATDNNSWTPLTVTDGVVQVTVKNKKDGAAQNYAGNTATRDTVRTPVSETANSGTESAGTGTSVTENSSSNAGQSLEVVVTYYKDSVKESSMLYETNESMSIGMLDTKDISSRSYMFKGCRLQKITLDGEEVEEIPDFVKVGSSICFYYVTDSNQ